MAQEKVFILSAKKYGFVDQETGERREGVTVYYIPALNPVISNDGVTKGHVPIKASFKLSEFQNFGDVPGFHNIEYSIGADSQGRPKFIYEGVSAAKA